MFCLNYHQIGLFNNLSGFVEDDTKGRERDRQKVREREGGRQKSVAQCDQVEKRMRENN